MAAIKYAMDNRTPLVSARTHHPERIEIANNKIARLVAIKVEVPFVMTEPITPRYPLADEGCFFSSNTSIM
jgi:hypothetical protein